MIELTRIAPASILAFVTTLHVALLALRQARGVAPRWLLLPMLLVSAAFSAATWIYSSLAAVGLGLAGHIVWFITCEQFTPRPAAEAHPAVSATPVTSGASSRARDFLPVPVVAVHDETPTIRTFRLARPSGFAFTAGQFVPVQIHADGQPHVRCYSISSAPEAAGYLDITVRRQGLVSSTLHAVVKPGATLLVRPPAGRFVYPNGDQRPIVLVGGGVGVTPLMSMLRHAVLAEPARPVSLLLSVRSSEDIAFQEELAWLPHRHPHARVAVTVTGPDARRNGFRTGRITAEMLTDHVPEPTDAVYLLCGPLPMIHDVTTLLGRLGVPDSQVRSEVFQAATAIGAVVSPASAASRSALVAEPSANARLTLSRSRRSVDVPAGTTLLEAAESAGVSIPSLCRSGVCGTCRTRLISGRARCTSDSLEAEDTGSGFVLPCVTWATGDCALEA
jgi:ferredoxin-NADP reductase